jgi:hypothetical protein
MKYPESLIRRLLILEGLQKRLTDELLLIRCEMREESLRIIERQDRQLDIWIHYQNENELDEALFMRKMLDMEVAGLANRTGMTTKSVK